MYIKQILIIALLSSAYLLSAQDVDRKIQFPDIADYKTLKCDFHIHTIFSDGMVWPDIRIHEAVRDGLDAISLTEHIEYQPWKADIKHTDRNRSYEIAKQVAKPFDLLIIHGTEITRDMPPGHANALFVTDVNKINVQDSIEAYRMARQQGAFIFWNHPDWMAQTKDGIPKLSDTHKMLIEQDLLHGIEVVNDLTFSQEALEIAVDNNLTVMGTSDIHGLVDWQFEIANGGHRPISLVFAKERTEEAIKEALFAGRTVAWFNNLLTGQLEHLQSLVNASVAYTNKGYIGDTDILQIELTNNSDARYILSNESDYDLHKDSGLVELLPHSTKMLLVLVAKPEAKGQPLKFKVLNAVSNKKANPQISINVED